MHNQIQVSLRNTVNNVAITPEKAHKDGTTHLAYLTDIRLQDVHHVNPQTCHIVLLVEPRC